ncbi:COA8 family protein CG14806, mitochondrial isoform X3 [Microplitis mediator]|uniref:COA8 family protein CG14806, mitochondrial isoform X3 n=1 Tax=Microplitis mediator TaxID=375433 RepID=UPI0025559D78|nr:COA8 family protein CG14806, mitochondrial isoform X3 [Microplitis mediator]XP_057325863.1 COA8 family protein CG14806, mitochondrial isoform X3 [Microplitis mediator]
MEICVRLMDWIENLNAIIFTRLTQQVSNLKDEVKKKDIIGPPDEVSNLRTIIFAKSLNETKLEKKYREARETTQNWNKKFWFDHNSKFITERKQFQKELEASGNKSITADEMSVFYKTFLDKNWKTHFNYNISWYKQNIRILFLELRVRLSKFKFK